MGEEWAWAGRWPPEGAAGAASYLWAEEGLLPGSLRELVEVGPREGVEAAVEALEAGAKVWEGCRVPSGHWPVEEERLEAC